MSETDLKQALDFYPNLKQESPSVYYGTVQSFNFFRFFYTNYERILFSRDRIRAKIEAEIALLEADAQNDPEKLSLIQTQLVKKSEEIFKSRFQLFLKLILDN